MERGEIHEAVSGQEEVGDEGSDGVQLGNDDATQGDDESQDVAVHGLVVLAVAASERLQIRVQLVLAQRLEHLRSGHETRQGRAERGGEAAGVDERPERRHELNDLNTIVDALKREPHGILPALLFAWKLFCSPHSQFPVQLDSVPLNKSATSPLASRSTVAPQMMAKPT